MLNSWLEQYLHSVGICLEDVIIFRSDHYKAISVIMEDEKEAYITCH